MTYTDLLARLEAATEGSRELDYEIVRVVFGDTRTDYELATSDFNGPYVLCYSSSIDDALTLLDGLRMKPHWTISYPAAIVELFFGDGEVIDADHATPALAVCLAFLRARQSLEERK